jgi:hypothetical protein
MAQNEKIGQKRIEMRTRLFPDVRPVDLWHRKTSTGFTTIPRALPLLLSLMDRLSKGKPVSATYFELWCRMFDESFVTLKPREMAYHAGFSGQRAEQTWAERMKILEKLKFIETKPGPEGDLSFAVVLNPYKIINKHFESKRSELDKAAYYALAQRMSDIGATDLDVPKPAKTETPPEGTPASLVSPPLPSSLRRIPPPRRIFGPPKIKS